MNTLHNLILIGGLATGLASVPIAAQARIIVDTGVPLGGCPLCQLSLTQTQWVAGRFQTGASTSIAMIDGYFGAASGRSFTIALLGDNGGLPGAELDSVTARYKGYLGWQGLSTLNWTIKPGAYWVAFEVTGSDNLVGGYMPYPAPRPLKVNSLAEDGTWAPAPKLGFGIRVLRPPDGSNKALNIPGAVAFRPAAVPEPSAWTMMLLGLGGLGAALRARRAQTSTGKPPSRQAFTPPSRAPARM